MASRPAYVILGAGQAGGWAAQTLRAEGFDGRITLVGDEAWPPYERPPLSKRLLAGDEGPEIAFLRDQGFYREHDVELRLGCRALALDRGGKRVTLDDGDTLPYDRLLLATGARVRRLALPGADLEGIHYLRTIDDALALRAGLASGAALVIVGAGYIGLEVAAAARGRGCRVTVIEMQDRPLSRVVAPEISSFLAEVHREQGVAILTGTGVTAFEGTGRVERIVCTDGSTHDADLVVIGVGIAPEQTLAVESGLDADDGVLVDQYGRTSDQAIYAAGDVANRPAPATGRRLRLESWQNAQNQAVAAARAMLGKGEPYDEIPWFWSDQYDLNLQIVGAPAAWDRVILRGDPGERRFVAFYLRDEVVVCANAVNSPRELRFARRLIEQGKPVPAEALADPDVPLKSL
jgi:3-phenylpropionate/trans-cinnamate dioxygenase ferredoxin reductase subunit